MDWGILNQQNPLVQPISSITDQKRRDDLFLLEIMLTHLIFWMRNDLISKNKYFMRFNYKPPIYKPSFFHAAFYNSMFYQSTCGVCIFQVCVLVQSSPVQSSLVLTFPILTMTSSRSQCPFPLPHKKSCSRS